MINSHADYILFTLMTLRERIRTAVGDFNHPKTYPHLSLYLSDIMTYSRRNHSAFDFFNANNPHVFSPPKTTSDLWWFLTTPKVITH